MRILRKAARSAALFCAAAMGLSAYAETTAMVLNLDFEDATTYSAGWSLSGNGGYSQQSRTMVQEDGDGNPLTSNFLRIHTGTGSGDRQYTGSYEFPSVVTDATDYVLEFDWFAAQNAVYQNTSLDMGLYLYAGSDVKVKIISNPVTLSGDKAQIYLNGSDTPEETTLDTAPAKEYTGNVDPDCAGTSNQDKWYRVILKANATDGLTLKILKNDLETVAFEETKVCDFVNLTKITIDMNKRRSNFSAYGGVDNLSVTVPAYASIDGVGYDSFASAVAAVVAGDVITLEKDIVLTESVVLPLGVGIVLNGNTLTTETAGVTVTFDDGFHYLVSNTEGDVTTFTETIALYDYVYEWTGGAEDNVWATPGNWSKNAVPAADSIVSIPAGDAIEIVCAGQTDYSGVLTIARDVTFSGTGITINSVSGDGKLTIKGTENAAFYVWNTGDFTVNTDLCLLTKFYVASGGNLTVKGALTGDAAITHYSGSSGSPSAGFRLYGDISGFRGSYTGCTRNNGDRDDTEFLGSALDGSNAAWQFGFRADKSRYPFQVNNATYKFGKLTTQYYKGGGTYMYRLNVSPATGVTLEVGALEGETSEVGGSLVDDSNTIRKVGETSVMNLRLTEAKGAVEVEAGTVNLKAAGDSANAPVSCTITGKGAIVTVADAIANSTLVYPVDDPATTEVDESEGEPTGTPFAPVLSEELAAAYCELKAEAGEGETTYSLYDIAQVGETTYKTIADAVAAATGEDKAITVIRTTEEPAVLATAGQTLTCAENVTCGAVSAVAGLVVEEENGVYTAADNTASAWTNEGGDNLWGTAANWSTGYVPDSATVVTLPDGAAIYTGTAGTAGYCGGMVVNGAVTIAYNASMGNYTAIQCNGDITGEGTLTLARAGINGNNKAITISANLAIENDTAAYTTNGHDSWLENGTFTIDGDVTVSGLFRTYASTTFNGAVSIVDGGTITSYSGNAPTFNGAVTLTGQSGIYTYAVTYNGAVTMGDEAVISVGSTTQTYGSGFVLNGSGTWIADTQNPATAVQTNLRGNNNNTWTGVCELYNFSVTTLTPSSYANNNSTVRLKGITAGNIAAGTYACGIELAGNGLTISGDYSRNITFSGKFSGSGALKVGTVGSSGFNLYITGDYSGFTGGVQFTNSSTRTRRVVFGASSTSSTGSCVVIAEGASLTVDSGAVWGPTNLVVLGEITFNGTLNIPVGGIWGSGTAGNRTIRFNDLSKAPNCAMFAGSWNGTCVLGDPAADGTEIKLYNFGNANSTIELAGVTAGYIGINGNTNVTSKVVLSGNVKLTNGWPTPVLAEGSMPTTRLTTLASVGGTGDLELNYTGTSSSWSSSSKGHIVVNKLDGAYTGDISIGNYWLLEVDAVDFAAAPTTAGEALIGVTVAENGTLYNAAHNAVTTSNGKAIDVTVAGVASTEKLVLGSDGLYLAVASVDGTYYATLQDAVDAAGANTVTLLADGQSATLDGGASVKIAKGEYDCTINVPAGYSISDSTDEGVTTYTTAEVLRIDPAAVTINYNSYATLSVVGYPEDATFGWTMYTNGVACSSTSGPVKISSGKNKATVKVYSETTAFDSVVARVAITNGEEVIEHEATITVADVAAKIGDTEYGKAELDDAIAAAIESGDVLEHYASVSTTISKGQTLKTKKLAERNGSASVKAAASTTAGEAWTIAKSEEDGVITWSVVTETAYFEFTSADSQTVEYLASPKNAVGTNKLLSDATITKQFSVTKDGVVLDLNGHALTSTFSNTSSGAFYVNVISPAPAALTVKDSVGGGSIAAASAHSVFMLGNNGQLTIESGSFTGKHIVYGTKTTSVATITGGTFEASDAGFTLNMLDSARGTITVTGGTFTGFNPANNSAEGAGTNFVPEGYVSTESATGVWTVVLAPSGIDPTDPTSSQEVTVDTTLTAEEQEAAAIAAATVTVPEAVSGVVDATTYKGYFKLAAAETSAGSGVYTVTIAGFADEVTETANANALAALQAATAGAALSSEVAVKPGLYYGTAAGADVTTLKASAGTLNTTGSLDLSGVTKPSTGAAYFIKIRVGATAFAAE